MFVEHYYRWSELNVHLQQAMSRFDRSVPGAVERIRALQRQVAEAKQAMDNVEAELQREFRPGGPGH
ncbi:hypothetical protein OC834_004475 [Tilletia horrida]|uniref:Uncharacterized protein n=1 Tax=Tilletia horrida TaxID=155126 RepID=A0AAN6JKV9_9BASI|nr:hypothetical protein OC834_004475 [Tilletia horrida]KAK0527345.1 hypothetical protein OC835_005012 [Tilletia horrida]KAK0531039.1 hypothetical protein OC842_003734 [Tilletia horrida]KAK0552984.1 hypothetical protein OC844_006368 [Tilletia horrida]